MRTRTAYQMRLCPLKADIALRPHSITRQRPQRHSCSAIIWIGRKLRRAVLVWRLDWTRRLQKRWRWPREGTVTGRVERVGRKGGRVGKRGESNPPQNPPLAKTDHGRWRRGICDGYRHELGSIFEADCNSEIRQLPDVQRDLVLHLIAAHHGWARPHFEPT